MATPWYQQSNNSEQIQLQQLMTKQHEQIALNRFYVYQNLEFLINLLHSYVAVKKYFQEDPSHPMIKTCINKIILQLNITNSVLFDLEKSTVDKIEREDLQKQKEICSNLFFQATQELPSEINSELSSFYHFFTETLFHSQQQKQLGLLQIEKQTTFDQQVVDKIIQGIQTTDQKIYQVKQMKQYEPPTFSALQSQAHNFKEYTIQKLLQNFPTYSASYYRNLQMQPNQQNQYENGNMSSYQQNIQNKVLDIFLGNQEKQSMQSQQKNQWNQK